MSQRRGWLSITDRKTFRLNRKTFLNFHSQPLKQYSVSHSKLRQQKLNQPRKKEDAQGHECLSFTFPFIQRTKRWESDRKKLEKIENCLLKYFQFSVFNYLPSQLYRVYTHFSRFSVQSNDMIAYCIVEKKTDLTQNQCRTSFPLTVSRPKLHNPPRRPF